MLYATASFRARRTGLQTRLLQELPVRDRERTGLRRRALRILKRHETHANRVRKAPGIKAMIRKAKSKPCTDCGNRYPPEAMDFDHVPSRGRKLFCISKCGGEWTVADIEVEMFKCDLVCAICHRLRTAARSRGATIGSVKFDPRPRLVK